MCFPESNDEDYVGLNCIATGWGKDRINGAIQDEMKEVELTVVDNRHCQSMYGLIFNIPIEKYHLCAGPVVSGGKGTCVVSINWYDNDLLTFEIL